MREFAKKLLPIASLSLLLLTGCGSGGSLPVAPTDIGPSPDTVGLPLPPQGATTPGTPDAHAQQLLAAMGQAQRALHSATYTGVMYCRGSAGTKPKALPTLSTGEWEATTTYQIAYKQPQTYRINVTQCSNPNSNGMQILVQRDQAQVRLSGVLGLMLIHKTLADKEMLNFRGHRLDEGSLDGLTRRFASAPVPEAHYAGQTNLDGQMLDVVEVDRSPSFDRTIVKEVLGLDPQTHLALWHAMFTSQRKVYEMRIRNLRLNPTLSADKFNI